MAKTDDTPVAARVRNSVGNVTFAQCRGSSVAKKKVNSNSSNTLPQRKQRLRMKAMLPLEEMIESGAEKGLKNRPADQDVHNAAISANLNEEVIQVSDDLVVTVNYEKVVCAKGRRMLPRTFSVTADAENKTLTFKHSTEARGRNRDKDDKFYALVLMPELKDSELYELDTRTNEEPVSITLPQEWDMDSIKVYVFALSKDGKIASDSRYLTVG
ncbi:MAG TPA: hypothetical protein H9863_04585 [Candidatus Odoribacter faecigallinarum]|uniref:Uncharacterized protein n=1 Tax=Candidatus Odoribacter faecigallinarum TaxID=2838706 RepID=A0A9D1UZR0_9BACT|nr:hypothetical protein [Candidatus Odoribacter faecigallinarum]